MSHLVLGFFVLVIGSLVLLGAAGIRTKGPSQGGTIGRAGYDADRCAGFSRNTAVRSAPNTRIPSSARKCVVRSASSTPVSA